MFVMAQRVAEAMHRAGIRADGITLLMDDGDAAGQGGLPRPPARHSPLSGRRVWVYVSPTTAGCRRAELDDRGAQISAPS